MERVEKWNRCGGMGVGVVVEGLGGVEGVNGVEGVGGWKGWDR